MLAACGKDKFQTVPQVSNPSLGPSEVFFGEHIIFTADVTDKEGDVQDSVVFCRKITPLSGNPVTVDSIRGKLTDFGIPAKTQEYELRLQFLYGQLDPKKEYEYQPATNVDRKFSIGVYVKDKAGNRSQYVESDKITLKKSP